MSKTDDVLGMIGTRGLVVHEGDPEGGTYAFYSDNDDQSWRTRRVDLGQFADSRGIEANLIESLVKSDVPVAVLKADAKVRTVFVNIEAFHVLGKGGSKEAGPIGKNPPATDDAFLIKEKGNYYAVGRKDLQSLDTADATEAKILVRRVAVTAWIPNND